MLRREEYGVIGILAALFEVAFGPSSIHREPYGMEKHTAAARRDRSAVSNPGAWRLANE